MMSSLCLPILLLPIIFLSSTIFAQNMDSGIGMPPPPSGPPPPPPFLIGATQDKIEEFRQLMANSGQMTENQIENAVKEWIDKQDAEIKTKFSAFESEKKDMLAAQEQARQKIVQTFSPKAKEADAKIAEIAKNRDMMGQEKAKTIQQLIQQLPEEVRAEIQKGAMTMMMQRKRI